jgi:hypothetical protein
METASTRRELVRTGVAASAAASAAIRSATAAAAVAPAQSDAAVLARTFQIEQLVSIAYQRVLGSRVLAAAVALRLRGLLSQELDHLAALDRAIRRLGATVPPAPAGVAAAQRGLSRYHVAASLTGLETRHECLKLLIDVESLAEGAYFSAISKLSDPALLRMSAEIMGCEAQHWTLLSELQHRGDVKQAVPYPFVEGSS